MNTPLASIIIRPSRGWRRIDFGEIWRFRELLSILAWRDIKVRYRETFLGILWVIGQPLITMGIFTLLFNRVARIESGSGIPYSLFVLGGLLPWTFFASGVQGSGNSLIGSSHLISKVYFPRLIVPIASVLVALVDLAVVLLLVLTLMAWYGIIPGPRAALLPLAIMLVFTFALGVGLWLSALTVEYRDVRIVTPFLLQIWMYATPVVYPLHVLPEPFRLVVELNPMTGILALFRGALFDQPIPLSSLPLPIGLAAITLVTGALYFRRVEREFADIL